MSRTLLITCAATSYIAFLAVFAWFAAFVLDMGTIRTGATGTAWPHAAAVDILLIAAFGLVHSVMARPGFKRRWTKIIPAAAERATYVLQSSVLLGAIFLLWQPIPVTVWAAEGILAAPLLVLFLGGLALIVVATFAPDHFEFTGLRQEWTKLHGKAAAAPRFRTPLPYWIVRHPLQLSLVIAVFSVPHMTADGLLFASVMLAYILVGLRFEERALRREFGNDYAAYQRRAPMLIPRLPLITKHRTNRRRV